MDKKEAVSRLKPILARRGGIIPDAARFEGLLRDYFPDDRGAREVLLAALREGIPSRLRSEDHVPRQVLRANLEGLLRRHRRMDQDAVALAVSVWAEALNVDLGTAPVEPETVQSIAPGSKMGGGRLSDRKMLFAAVGLPIGMIALAIILLAVTAFSKLPDIRPPANWADWEKNQSGDIRYALNSVWKVTALGSVWTGTGVGVICFAGSNDYGPGIGIGIQKNGTHINFIFGDDVDFAKLSPKETQIKVMADIDGGRYREEFFGTADRGVVRDTVITSTDPVFDAMRQGSVMVVTALVPGQPKFEVRLPTSFSLIHPSTWKSLISHSEVSAAYQAWQEVKRCATENGIKF